jgi:hypothetical protein
MSPRMKYSMIKRHCGDRTKSKIHLMSGTDPNSLVLLYMLIWQNPLRLYPSTNPLNVAINTQITGIILKNKQQHISMIHDCEWTIV